MFGHIVLGPVEAEANAVAWRGGLRIAYTCADTSAISINQHDMPSCPSPDKHWFVYFRAENMVWHWAPSSKAALKLWSSRLSEISRQAKWLTRSQWCTARVMGNFVKRHRITHTHEYMHQNFTTNVLIVVIHNFCLSFLWLTLKLLLRWNKFLPT